MRKYDEDIYILQWSYLDSAVELSRFCSGAILIMQWSYLENRMEICKEFDGDIQTVRWRILKYQYCNDIS